jgi:hypothetical protein
MEHRAHGRRLDDGAVRLAVVDTRALSEAAHNPIGPCIDRSCRLPCICGGIPTCR